MTVWWRGTRIVSAVGAGVLVLGGASVVHAIQPGEPSLDLAAADLGTWSRGSRAEKVIRFRIRLHGPGAEARLAVLTSPAEALRGIECPTRTRSLIRLPAGAGVCTVGDLPADGGAVDVLLTVPERPRDITLTALARMRGPGGETVQRGRSTISGSGAMTSQDGGVAAGPGAARTPVSAGGPVTREPVRTEGDVPPGTSVPAAAGPSRSRLAAAPASVLADPPVGTGAAGLMGMVMRPPQPAGEADGTPGITTGGSEADKAERRTDRFLFAVLEGSFFPEAPGSVAAGAKAPAGASAGTSAGTGTGTGTDAGAAVPAPAPADPSAPVPPGTRPPAGAVTPDIAQEEGDAGPGHGPADVVPKAAKVPAHRGAGRNHPATGAHAKRGTAGQKMSGRQRGTGRSGAGRQGAGRQDAARQDAARSMRGQMSPGRPGSGRQPMNRPGVRRPAAPGYPGAGPGQPGLPGQVVPGVLPPGMGGPMAPAYPGVGQGPAARPGVPQRGVAGPVGPGGYPGPGLPGAGQQPGGAPMAPPRMPAGPPMMPPQVPGGQGVMAAPQVPMVPPQLPGGQVPMVPPQAPGGQVPGGQMPMVPGGQVPGGQVPVVPPGSMGAAGSGPQLQLPPAGPFAAVQDARPQGAPLPQDLDGPAGQVRPVADESPLTGVRGLPAVGAAVGTLLGLLWLQRRIQRRRRSRHVL